MEDNLHRLLAVLACVVFCKGIKGETDLGLGLFRVKAWQTTQCSCCKRLLTLLGLLTGCCRTSIGGSLIWNRKYQTCLMWLQGANRAKNRA